MIISRYLKKEVIGSLLAVTLILLLIFLSNRLVRYLSYAALGKIPVQLLLQLIGFEIPYHLAILLPLGLFLGIVLTYSRLYAENEMRVLHACGMSKSKLMAVTGSLALLVAMITSLLMLWINPYIAVQKNKLLARQAGVLNIINTLVPGSFRVTGAGDKVVYVEKISRNRKQAQNIFMAAQLKNSPEDIGSRWMVLSADSAYPVRDKKTRDHFIVATEGFRYEGVPGQQDYKIIQFKKYALRVPHDIIASKQQEQETIPTERLLQHYSNPEYAAEFQWRIAIPLSVFILALLAIPLSQVQPRQSRYTMLLPAILVYVVYANLLFVSRKLIGEKIIPTYLGMWWVHGLMFFILILIFFIPMKPWAKNRL